MARHRLPSAWAQEFAGLLQDIGWPGVDPGSTEHQAVQRWQALLAEFGASDDVAGPMRAHAALGHLRELAGSTSFEPQEIAAPLLVIDPQTALGMRFDALWVCGLDAAHWPAPASPDPFLPREWQTRQQLPGATAQLAEADARRTLDRLCRAAPVVVCSVPRFKDEAPLLPSALVADLPRKTTLDLWGGTDATRTLFEARPALDTLLDGTLPAFAAHDVVKGGARLLELQAACPFRAAVELRLGGTELEEPQSGIAPSERGRLVHAVLQAFWLDVRDHAALVAVSAGCSPCVSQNWSSKRSHRCAQRETTCAADCSTSNSAGSRRAYWNCSRRRGARAVHGRARPRIRSTVDVGGVQVRVMLDRVDRLADGSSRSSTTRPVATRNRRPGWANGRSSRSCRFTARMVHDEVSAVAFGNVRKGGDPLLGLCERIRAFSRALQRSIATRADSRTTRIGRRCCCNGSADSMRSRANTQRATRGSRPNPTQGMPYCHLPGLCRIGEAFIEAEEGDDERGEL